MLARRHFWRLGLGHCRLLHPRGAQHPLDLRQHLHLEPRAKGYTRMGQPHLLRTSSHRRGHLGRSRLLRRVLDCGGQERLPQL